MKALSTCTSSLLLWLHIIGDQPWCSRVNSFTTSTLITTTSSPLSSLSPLSPSSAPSSSVVGYQHRATRRYNFFKNLLDNAFENDANLAKDKSVGQLDDSADGDDEQQNNPANRYRPSYTKVQQEWRERQQGLISTPQLEGTRLNVQFYLTGIPQKDPSNDLYGAKSNISSRDRTIGLTVPDAPTVSNVTLQLCAHNVLTCTNSHDNEFMSNDIDGEWKLSEDTTMIRFSVHVEGYQKTVLTKGSISKIYWSEEEEATTQTSSAYTVPAGVVYLDAHITRKGNNPILDTIAFDQGIVRVAQSVGLLGVSSRLVPCGRFAAQEEKKTTAEKMADHLRSRSGGTNELRI